MVVPLANSEQPMAEGIVVKGARLESTNIYAKDIGFELGTRASGGKRAQHAGAEPCAAGAPDHSRRVI